MGELRRVKFPDWDRRRLERAAVDHTIDLAMARGQVTADFPVGQLVVNMLRHEFTSYDERPTQAAHRAACEAIAGRYPWLAEECHRQVAVRAERERQEREWLAVAEEQQAAWVAWRRERVMESQAVCARLGVGMPVTVKVKGHQRDATVVKVGRSRVTVRFRLKSGAERTALVYAREVRPA